MTELFLNQLQNLINEIKTFKFNSFKMELRRVVPNVFDDDDDDYSINHLIKELMSVGIDSVQKLKYFKEDMNQYYDLLYKFNDMTFEEKKDVFYGDDNFKYYNNNKDIYMYAKRLLNQLFPSIKYWINRHQEDKDYLWMPEFIDDLKYKHYYYTENILLKVIIQKI